MKILFLNYAYDNTIGDPDALIDRYRVIHEWCRALRSAGADSVIVVQRFGSNAEFSRDGIEYYFINDGGKPVLYWWHDAKRVNEFSLGLSPDVVHVNGIAYFLPQLRRSAGNGTAILLQSHFNRMPRPGARLLWKHSLAHADGVILTSAAQAAPWKRHGIMSPSLPLFEIPGASTFFRPLPYDRCRTELGVADRPLFLWVGRLHPKKDPLTVLKGFSMIAADDPGACLYMIYGSDELLPKVRRTIGNLGLHKQVRLIGYVPHHELPKYYSAADFFVLGSRAEVCGFALIEAIACGALPVVPDIPSFRTLTDDGINGMLWQPESPESFRDTAVKAYDRKHSRQNIRDYFERQLSYEILGNSAMQAYRHAYAKRNERIN
jgi:glycosyltransferase involved in cell wall biosynthesis